jgi:hypothetical protein
LTRLIIQGWTNQEAETFRRAVIKFGVGNWRDIVDSGCLKGKTNAQMNMLLQRMLGQQSIAGLFSFGETVNPRENFKDFTWILATSEHSIQKEAKI